MPQCSRSSAISTQRLPQAASDVSSHCREMVAVAVVALADWSKNSATKVRVLPPGGVAMGSTVSRSSQFRVNVVSSFTRRGGEGSIGSTSWGLKCSSDDVVDALRIRHDGRENQVVSWFHDLEIRCEAHNDRCSHRWFNTLPVFANSGLTGPAGNPANGVGSALKFRTVWLAGRAAQACDHRRSNLPDILKYLRQSPWIRTFELQRHYHHTPRHLLEYRFRNLVHRSHTVRQHCRFLFHKPRSFHRRAGRDHIGAHRTRFHSQGLWNQRCRTGSQCDD